MGNFGAGHPLRHCAQDPTVADSLAHLAAASDAAAAAAAATIYASHIALSPCRSDLHNESSYDTAFSFPWQNPRARRYRRTLAVAMMLAVAGVLFLCASASSLFDYCSSDADIHATRFLGFLAVATLTLAPGFYVLHHAWHALTNRPGYSMDMIPSYD